MRSKVTFTAQFKKSISAGTYSVVVDVFEVDNRQISYVWDGATPANSYVVV
jgi:hypothetical protein